MLDGVQSESLLGYQLAMSDAKAHLGSAATGARRKFEIAKFFRERRIAAGLDLAQMAEAMGVENVATLVAYENGDEAIPLDEVFGMANILNIPPEDVLGLVYDLYGKQGRT